uniref:DDE_Tnp_1_7 domain-containing protein n=1 Tax=Heterorhabditis bacteriophora TaxID=37862 RepID=A0A1I7WEQ4_HETBA
MIGEETKGTTALTNKSMLKYLANIRGIFVCEKNRRGKQKGRKLGRVDKESDQCRPQMVIRYDGHMLWLPNIT